MAWVNWTEITARNDEAFLPDRQGRTKDVEIKGRHPGPDDQWRFSPDFFRDGSLDIVARRCLNGAVINGRLIFKVSHSSLSIDWHFVSGEA